VRLVKSSFFAKLDLSQAELNPSFFDFFAYVIQAFVSV